MTDGLPPELAANLTGAALDSVAKWWLTLSQPQCDAVRQLLASPDCALHATAPDDPSVNAAVDLFADDWESHWEDNWESDWREYLTEHPDVRLVTLDFMCYTIRYGQ